MSTITQKVILTIGLPGSGKTTWAVKYCKENPNFRRINNDDIRAVILDPDVKWTPKLEDEVRRIRNNQTNLLLFSGYDLIIDNTHLNPKTLRKTKEFIRQSFPQVVIEEKSFLDVMVYECVRHDAERIVRGERGVGSKVIFDMAHKAGLEIYPKLKSDPNLLNCIICDLDGTLALFGNRRSAYDASNCHFVDEINPAVQHVLQTYIFDDCNFPIFFFSGRTDKYKEQTIKFLHKAGFILTDGFISLAMRKEGDFRADTIVKEEMYNEFIKDKFNVLFCLDDRPSVVRLWKELGLNVFNVGDNIEF